MAAGAGGRGAATADGDALLAAIREREAQLEAEEKRLADRAQTAERRRGEARRAARRLRDGAGQPGEDPRLADQAAERDIARMTTVYENMKPADAARIFERMDVAFAAGLLARMRPEIAAKVLTGMNADAAYAVTADHRQPQRRGSDRIAGRLEALLIPCG